MTLSWKYFRHEKGLSNTFTQKRQRKQIGTKLLSKAVHLRFTSANYKFFGKLSSPSLKSCLVYAKQLPEVSTVT